MSQMITGHPTLPPKKLLIPINSMVPCPICHILRTLNHHIISGGYSSHSSVSGPSAKRAQPDHAARPFILHGLSRRTPEPSAHKPTNLSPTIYILCKHSLILYLVFVTNDFLPCNIRAAELNGICVPKVGNRCWPNFMYFSILNLQGPPIAAGLFSGLRYKGRPLVKFI